MGRSVNRDRCPFRTLRVVGIMLAWCVVWVYRVRLQFQIRQIWKQFNKFFLRLDRKPPSWEDRLTLFVHHLIQEKKKANMIRCYISAVKSVLKDNGVVLCKNKYLISSLTKAWKLNSNMHVRTRLPIQKGMLTVLLKTVNNQFAQQPYLRRLYSALLSTAYFGLFRIGEVTQGTHPVLAKDVHIGVNKNKLKFILRTSKTHWIDSKLQIIKISSVDFNESNQNSNYQNENLGHHEENQFCPYQILRNFLELRGGFKTIDEPFFVFRDRAPVTPEQIRKILKAAMTDEGFDANFYNFQSLRSGRTVDLIVK